MPKLHLKRTPEEEAERAWRKERKAERKAKRHARRAAADDADDQPRASSSKQPDEQRMGEDSFTSKLRDAMEDDGLFDPSSRLDSMHANMNTYDHIPRRWRGTDSAGIWMEEAADDMGVQPHQMNDDEYAAYIRAGMWRSVSILHSGEIIPVQCVLITRKTHEEELKEKLRRKQERKDAAKRARAAKEETARLEREARERREQQREERSRRRLRDAQVAYEEGWKTLLSKHDVLLSIENIPWPVLPTLEVKPDSIRPDKIRALLLDSEDDSRARDILRTNLLRYHPDKFEPRVLKRVKDTEKELVKELAMTVVRTLNDMLKDAAL